jgi:uncharacterized membrane protein
MSVKIKNRTLKQTLPFILAIGGAVGFLAALVLTIDKIKLLQNPAYVPSCNLSPLISCGSVMKTAQASHFGFPNSILGVGGFAVVTTIGVALIAGAQFKKWFWQGLNLGALLGVLGIHWLIFESIYRIGALCPYCMVVWVVTIPVFWYVTLYNLREGNVPKLKISGFLQRHHGDVLIVWFGIILAMVLTHFWYYWSTLL